MSTLASPRPDTDGLGLDVDVVEDLLVAIVDREDIAGPDERARLQRGRRAIERELARRLAI